MKILFCVRHNFYEMAGGAYIQIIKTKEYLEKLGIECEITDKAEGMDFSGFDIVHLTDLTATGDLLLYLKELKSYKGKKVLSTIYWPFDDYASSGTPLLQRFFYKTLGINGFELIKSIAKFLIRREKVYLQGISKSYIQKQIDIVKSVDWLLPNSQMEMDALNDRLGLSLKNYTVVNNAIDSLMYDEIISDYRVSRKQDLITFVARIDPRKNQLNFLKAMMDTDYRIRFIGNVFPQFQSYYDELKGIALERGNVEFISHLSQEDLFKHTMEAKVNVLTSWIETPGLVSLEAAYAGCNIVVSDKGSVRDYFKDYAFYCMPDNLESIKKATIEAMESEASSDLRDLIKQDYSWSTTAEQTLNGYQSVLNNLKM